MANDITLKPKLKCDNNNFEEYIENFEVLFKTNKDSFIGTFNSWNISLNLNKNDIEMPETLKFELEINKKNQKLPTFILNPVRNEETTEEVQIKGYDKSILFDGDFEWTQTLPCTAGQLAQNISDKVGVPLKDTNFANSDFMIYRQMVDNKRTNREVMAMIGAIAGGNVFINEDDEVEIRSFIDSDLIVEEYFSSEKFVKVGPITGVNLAREPIKDYKELNDAALSAKYKSCMIKITNNLIVDDNRELAIQPIYDKLHGLEFYCKKIETHEAYSVEPFSFIQCAGNKVLVDTICIKYPTLLDSYISSNQLTEVESNVSEKNKDLKQRVKNAEAKVDEVEGKINLLTTEVSDYNNKISELEVTVDSITQKVENVADLTREVNGATKIQLDDCMQGELIELHICGNNTVFDSQYLSDDLYLDDDVDLFGDSLIKITRQEKDGENIKEVFEIIDLGIDTVLRQYEGVFDEYVIKDNKAQIIRRIGVDENNNKYVLENEVIEDLGELQINLSKGTNYIEILNYVANIKAKYVVINDITSKFATVAILKTSIAQMADSINLTLSKKLNKEDIIAAINMAVLKEKGEEVSEKDVEKSIIQIIANILEIDTDNLKLQKDGTTTIIKGIIAGLNLWADYVNGEQRSWLTKDFTSNGNSYRSGLLVRSNTYNSDFIFAGMPINGNDWSTADANLRIFHNGEVNAKWLSVNGESGYFYVDYDNKQHAMVFTKDGINRYLNNGSRWIYEGTTYVNDIADAHSLFLYDAKSYNIYDAVHEQYLASFIKNDGANKPSSIWFYGDCWIDQNRTGTASRILTAANYSSIVGSDKKLKKNIKTTNQKALDIIDKIKFVEFDWNDKATKFNKNGHVSIGVIANDLKEIYENLVVYNEIDDIHSIDILNFITLNGKSIQELSKENRDLRKNQIKMQKQLDFLVEKLNCKEELENYMKEEE